MRVSVLLLVLCTHLIIVLAHDDDGVVVEANGAEVAMLRKQLAEERERNTQLLEQVAGLTNAQEAVRTLPLAARRSLAYNLQKPQVSLCGRSSNCRSRSSTEDLARRRETLGSSVKNQSRKDGSDPALCASSKRKTLSKKFRTPKAPGEDSVWVKKLASLQKFLQVPEDKTLRDQAGKSPYGGEYDLFFQLLKGINAYNRGDESTSAASDSSDVCAVKTMKAAQDTVDPHLKCSKTLGALVDLQAEMKGRFQDNKRDTKKLKIGESRAAGSESGTFVVTGFADSGHECLMSVDVFAAVCPDEGYFLLNDDDTKKRRKAIFKKCWGGFLKMAMATRLSGRSTYLCDAWFVRADAIVRSMSAGIRAAWLYKRISLNSADQCLKRRSTRKREVANSDSGQVVSTIQQAMPGTIDSADNAAEHSPL